MKNRNGGNERRAIVLAWLFHLAGDIHHPLHTAQLFTTDYPQRDRGGNEICLRVTEGGQPMDLYRFWDGVITSRSNLTRLRNQATALRNGQEFQRSQLTELASTSFESRAKESFEISTKIPYRNDGRIGSPKVGIWIARWSQPLPCFLWATLLARAVLLIGGWFRQATAWPVG